ncbi:MAG: hypothetical protein KTR31_23860 [Myxococcales bacterium]|nr:hypothetical protein [Myxococcales bacterium]
MRWLILVSVACNPVSSLRVGEATRDGLVRTEVESGLVHRAREHHGDDAGRTDGLVDVWIDGVESGRLDHQGVLTLVLGEGEHELEVVDVGTGESLLVERFDVVEGSIAHPELCPPAFALRNDGRGPVQLEVTPDGGSVATHTIEPGPVARGVVLPDRPAGPTSFSVDTVPTSSGGSPLPVQVNDVWVCSVGRTGSLVWRDTQSGPGCVLRTAGRLEDCGGELGFRVP